MSAKDAASTLMALGNKEENNDGQQGGNEGAKGGSNDANDDRSLMEMKRKLESDGYSIWAKDLEIERRGKYPYFRHPRLPGYPTRWYDRYISSSGHVGLLEAIQNAEAGIGPSSGRGTTTTVEEVDNRRRDALLDETQVNECVRSVHKLLRHVQALEEEVRRLTSDLARNDEGIAVMESQLQSMKRQKKS